MTQSVSPAAQRYLIRFMPAMALYVAALLGVVSWFAMAKPPAGLIRYLVSIIPALPLLVCAWAYIAYLEEEPDEFQRTLAVRSALWALGLILCITTVLGFLETFAGTPRFPLYLIFPLFACLSALMRPVVQRLYR